MNWNKGFLTIFQILILCLFFSIFSCTKNLQREVFVYQNSFEKQTPGGIQNAVYSSFNGNNVLGRYATGGFDLFIDKIPEHDLIQVSFDLYIHDNWKGNSPSGVKDSSDIWIMNFDGNNEKYTTFSNISCNLNLCSSQAYPGNFPFPSNPPGANALRKDLPGACSLQKASGGTSKYRITRTTYHTAPNFHLGCYAQLFSHDKNADPLCDASWSIDNLEIKALKFGE